MEISWKFLGSNLESWISMIFKSYGWKANPATKDRKLSWKLIGNSMKVVASNPWKRSGLSNSLIRFGADFYE
jgi:hypothetical protein